MSTLEERIRRGDLWDAINRYAAACGGDPSRHVYGNTARQKAVAEVEEHVLRMVAAAIKISIVADAAESQAVEINADDVKVELTYPDGYNRGGQHVGYVRTGIKVTHVPTGISAESSDERSQHANKVEAMKRLRVAIAESKEGR